MKPSNFLVTIIIILMFSSSCYSASSSFDINSRLGRGINIGNTFEAPSETAWGNPWKPEYFEMIASLGFNHVRIPINWETDNRSLLNYPYTIDENFKNRIVEVVDKALQEGLMVIINMHHHTDFMNDPIGQKDRLLSLWTQVAEIFKDYPEELLFEVLNEPTGAATPAIWNSVFSEALSVIRASNPTRTVLLGVAEFGGLSGVTKLEFPNDDHLILTIHFYSPFTFTHQGAEWNAPDSEAWMGTTWNDTEAERMTVANEFSQAIQIGKDNNIPIHIGEFGAYSKADMKSRERWTTFTARWFEEQGFSWTYWEFSSGFGIYDVASKSFYQGLVDALLHNEMPMPAEVSVSTIYSSNFGENYKGWVFNTYNSATGSSLLNNGDLIVHITTPGAELWNAQLIYTPVSLEAKKDYMLVVNGSSVQGRNAQVHVGENRADWGAYSDYYNILFTSNPSTFIFNFKMGNISDMGARIVFDLGGEVGDLALSEVKMEEVKLLNSSFISETTLSKVWYSSDSNIVGYSSDDRVNSALLYDISGAVVGHYTPNESQGVFPVGGILPGIYFVQLNLDDTSNEVFKIFLQ